MEYGLRENVALATSGAVGAYLYTGTSKGYCATAVALGGDKERRRGQQTSSECWCWPRVLRAGQEDSDTTASGEKLVFAL